MKTMGELRTFYGRMIETNRALKPNTKKYYHEDLKYGWLRWDGLDAKDIVGIKKIDCIEWAAKLVKYSASRYNWHP